LQHIASQELQVSADELEDRLQQLYNLLPGKCSNSPVVAGACFQQHTLHRWGAMCNVISTHKQLLAYEHRLRIQSGQIFIVRPQASSAYVLYMASHAIAHGLVVMDSRCGCAVPARALTACNLLADCMLPVPLLQFDNADLASRLVKAPPKRVARLAANTDVIAARLLRLRDIFPQVRCCATLASMSTAKPTAGSLLVVLAKLP
jgi:hypothetical protein